MYSVYKYKVYRQTKWYVVYYKESECIRHHSKIATGNIIQKSSHQLHHQQANSIITSSFYKLAKRHMANTYNKF